MKKREDYEQAWQALPERPRERGQVTRVVVRPATNERVLLQTVRVTPEDGLTGDRWGTGKRNPENQITLMMEQVVSLVATPSSPPELAGDNLYVTIDLAEDCLPAGTRLQIGSALVEVTPLPHYGCKKFSARFGSEALKWINSRDGKRQRLRGLHVQVIEAGDIAVGSDILVKP